jgi:hypothetical protein
MFEVSADTLKAARAYEESRAMLSESVITLEDVERPLNQPRLNATNSTFKWYWSKRAVSERASGSRRRQQKVTQYGGEHLLNSFDERVGDRLTARLWTAPFEMGRRSVLSFKLGGGSLKRGVGVRLWVNGVAVSSWGGADSEQLKQHHVDLRMYPNALIQLEIFDQARRAWGHVLFDDLWLSASIADAIAQTRAP